MRYAILSDIHANLEALEAVLTDAGGLPVLCLGDVVGYGPQPNEVIDRLRTIDARVIMGNHDIAAVDGSGIEDFNPVAAASAAWTSRHLTNDNHAWLATLPFIDVQPTYTLVHGSPHEPEQFHYVLNSRDMARAFGTRPSSWVTFIGHSHLPMIVSLDINTDIIRCHSIEGNEYRLFNSDERYIVNVGSVGQPRDGDSRAAYVIYDDDTKTIDWRRVPYDINAVQQKIRATSLPHANAQRIKHGR